MRRTLFSMLAAVLVAGCADVPSAPQLTPSEASFAFGFDHPPPPFAIIEGDVNGATYEANFFVNKPGNVAWLMFTGGAGVTFSQNARIMSVNGNVSGFGTMRIGTTTYQLNTVTEFNFDGDCTGTIRSSCADFSGSGFQSTRAEWTGRLAYDNNNRIGKPGWDGPPGGGNGGGGEVCYLTCDYIKGP